MIARFKEPIGDIIILIDDKGNGEAVVCNNYIPIQKTYVVRDWTFTVNYRLSYRIKVDKLAELYRIETTIVHYSPIEY
jgi:hypothetical protein